MWAFALIVFCPNLHSFLGDCSTRREGGGVLICNKDWKVKRLFREVTCIRVGFFFVCIFLRSLIYSFPFGMFQFGSYKKDQLLLVVVVVVVHVLFSIRGIMFSVSLQVVKQVHPYPLSLSFEEDQRGGSVAFFWVLVCMCVCWLIS